MPRLDGSEKRIDHLSLILLGEGMLHRNRVSELLGVKVVRASQAIREFREAHQDWTEWKQNVRAEVATPKFFEWAQENQPDRLLADYFALSQSGAAESLAEAYTSIYEPDVTTFSMLNQAILRQLVVTFNYQEPSASKAVQHTVCLHRLVRSQQAWHARGYCYDDVFRTFNLAGVTDVVIQNVPHNYTAEHDTEWCRQVELKLVPHPRLSTREAKWVKSQLLYGAPAKFVQCRAAMVPLFILDHQIAVRDEEEGGQRVLLANADQLSDCL